MLKDGLVRSQSQTNETDVVKFELDNVTKSETDKTSTQIGSRAANEASEAQTAIANTTPRSVTDRDFILIITIGGGLMLVIAFALTTLVVVKFRRDNRSKKEHEEEMRRVKQAYDNQMYNQSVVAVNENSNPSNFQTTSGVDDSQVNALENKIPLSNYKKVYYNEEILDDNDLEEDDDEDELNRSMRF